MTETGIAVHTFLYISSSLAAVVVSFDQNLLFLARFAQARWGRRQRAEFQHLAPGLVTAGIALAISNRCSVLPTPETVTAEVLSALRAVM